MKIRHNTKNVILSAVAIVFMIGLLLGSLFCADRMNATQKLLEATQENLHATREAFESAMTRLQHEHEVNENLKMNLAEAETTIVSLKSDEYEFIYMGDFKLTHYCTETHEHICGEGNDLTATGTKVTPGRTIAVDPTIIPYGAQVYIEGYGFRTAEDCGGAVNGSHIDIAVSSHSDALSMGTKTGGVWLLIKKGS